MSTREWMRSLWERWGSTMTRSAIHIDGVTRPMTEEEKKAFDASFALFDESFSHMDKLFEEVRKKRS